MDFDDTPEEAEFRKGARAFLDRTARRREPGEAGVYRGGLEKPEVRAAAKAFQAKKAEAGYAAITWAKEWGGRGGSAIEQVIYNQEESKYAIPRGMFDIGLGMCIPTLCTWGTQSQRDRFAKPALRGEEVWCQLFSEPAAGSDLAGLRTRAEKDGEDWIVNGQKIWTSGAHYCDWGVLVTRTDFSAPKHKGLTYFFLDMKSPGIEIKPIRQISGASHFNEVFFENVRIPDSQRLGAVGDGWKVSLTTLMNERYTIGGRTGTLVDVDDVLELARKVELEDGPALKNEAVRDKLADWFVMSQGLKYSHFRTMTALSRGQTPGPESSIGKLVTGPKLQAMAAFAMDLMEQGGVITDPELAPMAALFQQTLMTSPSSRIAGGSDEIMRNIIAERVLGLPADVRVDKDVPFNKLPTGKR
jgi:alkylation response protein AidB-like acyl-CoA dehydrogenase